MKGGVYDELEEVIVGDAFRLPSREVNYYRDLLLAWPILLFSVGTLTSLFGKSHDLYLHTLGAAKNVNCPLFSALHTVEGKTPGVGIVA